MAEDLRREVAALRPGDRLSTSREIVTRHRVSPVTVSRALAALAAEGLVVTRPGSGTYVAEPPEAHRGTATRAPDMSWQTVALGDRTVDANDVLGLISPSPEGAVRLSGGYLHATLQPARALTTALARAGRRPDAWEQPPVEGVAELRSWFARSIGGDITAADVLITGGGQAALSAAFRALSPPGAPLLVEAPTYPGALAAARMCGLRPVPVPTDDRCVRPDMLAEAFGMTGALAFYCQPTFHNPTGTTLPTERREQVLAVTRAAGAFVVEDDYARHLTVEGSAPPPLAALDTDGVVVHVASLTKATAPSLRIAALMARGPAAARLRAARVVADLFVSRPLQEAALELVSSPAWNRHLAALASSLHRRRDALVRAVRAELPDTALDRVPSGGLHLWTRLPEGTDDVALAGRAREYGVLVGAGSAYFSAEAPAPYLRLSYGAAANTAELAEGVRRLAHAWRPVR